MAALNKCKDCGHEISKTAEACPNCGARLKRRWNEVGSFVTTLFFVTLCILIFIFVLVGSL